MVKTFDILLDLEKELYSPSSLLFSVSRNDFNTVQLNFVITQDGTPVDLLNKTVELAVKKPSGLTLYQACEITSAEEGKAKIALNQQAYIEYGIYTAEVYIRDVTQLAVTSPFWYQSRTPIFNDTTEEAIESSNDWSALQEALFAYDLRPQITNGFPTITPEYIGQIALDTLNGIAYISTGLSSDDWIVFGGGGSDTLFGDNAPIITPARIGQLFIDQTNKGAYISTGVMVEDWEQIDNEAFVKEAITWAEVLDKPIAFTPEIHTHDYIDIQGKPLVFPPEEHGHDWAEVTGKPLTFTPEAHNHEIGEITGLQASLDSKADDVDLNSKANSADVYTKLETYNKTEIDNKVVGAEVVVEDNLNSNSASSALSANQGRNLKETKADLVHGHDWAEVTGKPTSFTPEVHNHEIGEVTGLQTSLDSKDIKPAIVTAIPATTPNYIGQMAVDGTNKRTYIAEGSTSGDWRRLATTLYADTADNYIIGTLLDGLKLWSGTQAEYEAIATKDELTLYFITPSKPILKVTNLTNAVQLDWEVGTGASWAIWRSEVKNTLGTKIAEAIITNTYLDSTASGGKNYYYTLQVEDVSRKTISDQVEATPYSITVYGSKRVEFAGYAGWTVYGDAQATADFGNQFTLQGGERLKIDTAEKLRFEMPIGMVGSANTGGIIKAKIAGKNTYTFEYAIRFDSGFPWSKGGKVPGFSGGAGYTGGEPAWAGDGFSVRMMWREDGRIIPYVYHYNQPDEFGDTFGETLGYFTHTQEHKIKYFAVLNTGSNADGILKIYLDDVQVFEKTDLVYRTDESLIDTAHLAIFAGGSDASWNMTASSYIRLNYFDWK